MAGGLRHLILATLEVGPCSAQEIAAARHGNPTRSQVESMRQCMHTLADGGEIHIGYGLDARVECQDGRLSDRQRRVLMGWIGDEAPMTGTITSRIETAVLAALEEYGEFVYADLANRLKHRYNNGTVDKILLRVVSVMMWQGWVLITTKRQGSRTLIDRVYHAMKADKAKKK